MGDSRAMYYSSIGYWLLLLRLPPREPGFKILKLSSKKVSIRFVLFWFCFFVGGPNGGREEEDWPVLFLSLICSCKC